MTGQRGIVSHIFISYLNLAMARPPSLSPEKTTVELEPDVRQYLERRVKEEGRSLKWLINNALRKEMLAELALQRQPELFREKA